MSIPLANLKPPHLILSKYRYTLDCLVNNNPKMAFSVLFFVKSLPVFYFLEFLTECPKLKSSNNIFYNYHSSKNLVTSLTGGISGYY